jgi:apolipoprotein N-acyltransferase
VKISRLLPSAASLFRYGVAFASGAALHLAFAPLHLELLAWVGLLPLLALLWPLREDQPALRHPFRFGYAAGLGFYLFDVSWVRHSSRVIGGALDHSWIGWGPELLGATAALGLAGYLACYVGLWTWLVSRLARPAAVALSQGTALESTLEALRCATFAAAAWVGTEWLRGWVITGFSWNTLGVALQKNTTLIQIADIVGATGLSFLPVFIAGVAWINWIRLVRHWRGSSTVRTRLDFTLAMVLLLGTAVYGMFRIRSISAEETVPVRVLLVQPNLPQVVLWNNEDPMSIYRLLNERTRLYAESRDGRPGVIDLVVWPESGIPFPLDTQDDLREFHQEYFDDLLSKGPFSLLAGAVTRAEDSERSHNSAVLFAGGYANAQRAHKIHLVPFGEFLPFRETLPFMETLLGSILPGDFEPGKVFVPLTLETAPQPVQLIPLICFEDTVGRIARRFIRPAPQILANVTNDGWFLQSNETEVHQTNARFRAIELRRPMLRAANTGVSCFIDSLGRVTSQLSDPETGSTFIEGCLPGVVQVPTRAEITFYAKHGDVFALGCSLWVGVSVLLGLLRRKKPVSPPAER